MIRCPTSQMQEKKMNNGRPLLGVEGELSSFNDQTEAKLEERKRKRTREVCHEGIVIVDAVFNQEAQSI